MTPQEVEKWMRARRAGPTAYARQFALYSTLVFACINLAIRLSQEGPVKWTSWLVMTAFFAAAMYAVGLAIWRRQEEAYRKQTNTGA